MSALLNLENTFEIPPDLTGEVKYEEPGTTEVRGGHAHVCKGTWTTSDGTTIQVGFLSPSYCYGYKWSLWSL